MPTLEPSLRSVYAITVVVLIALAVLVWIGLMPLASH